jgi:hypothetical protein
MVANALMRMIESPRMKDMGIAAKKNVEDFFLLKQQVEKYIALF